MKQENKKAILIEKNLHNDLKSYCKQNSYILKSLVEKLIKNELSKNIQSNNTKS